MSDFNEMAEALEQSRTCPEAGDKAAVYQVMAEISGVAAVREKLQGQGAEFCIDCDEAIPAKRRAAAPWAQRCISCQDDHDKREARRHV